MRKCDMVTVSDTQEGSAYQVVFSACYHSYNGMSSRRNIHEPHPSLSLKWTHRAPQSHVCRRFAIFQNTRSSFSYWIMYYARQTGSWDVLQWEPELSCVLRRKFSKAIRRPKCDFERRIPGVFVIIEWCYKNYDIVEGERTHQGIANFSITFDSNRDDETTLNLFESRFVD
jgi:hypothetical protein